MGRGGQRYRLHLFLPGRISRMTDEHPVHLICVPQELGKYLPVGQRQPSESWAKPETRACDSSALAIVPFDLDQKGTKRRLGTF